MWSANACCLVSLPDSFLSQSDLKPCQLLETASQIHSLGEIPDLRISSFMRLKAVSVLAAFFRFLTVNQSLAACSDTPISKRDFRKSNFSPFGGLGGIVLLSLLSLLSLLFVSDSVWLAFGWRLAGVWLAFGQRVNYIDNYHNYRLLSVWFLLGFLCGSCGHFSVELESF
jgi:hypothetical protein